MRKPAWSIVILTLALILSAACEGGTSGSVVGSRTSCSHKVGSGSCKGSYRTLRGTYSEDVENDRIFSGTPVQVEVAVAVEGGSVRVWVKSPGDEKTSALAEPGTPTTLSGIAEGESEEFSVYFEAVDGEASGVSYEILYEIR